MPDIALLIVNYRSASLTKVAVDSARASTAASLEIVVVDNSESDEEIEALGAAKATVIRAPRNLGYGAAINLGAARCSAGLLVVSNPDVVFGSGCIDELVAALDRFDMTGPRIAWDEAGEWLLPPADLASASSKWSEVAAGLCRPLQRRFDRDRTRQRIAFWSAIEPTRVEAISGAVMCFRRDLISRVGKFDERFHLYFEEIDFMRRMKAAMLAIGIIPAARCRHLYSQTLPSTRTRDDAYARSEELYFDKWSSTSWRLAKRLGRPLRALPVDEEVTFRGTLRLPSGVSPERVIIEVSPLASFFTAAGHFPTSDEVAIPSAIVETLKEDTLFARIIERSTGRVLRVIRVRKSE